MLSWLRVVQNDLVLGDDDLVSALLRLPSYERGAARAATSLVNSSNNRHLLKNNFLSAKGGSFKATPGDSNAAQRVTLEDHFSADRGAASHHVTTLHRGATGSLTSAPSAAVAVYEEEEKEVVSADGTWKGTGIHNFQFLDLSAASRHMYADCSYNHSFKVRGLSYMDDKKKVSLLPLLAAVRRH